MQDKWNVLGVASDFSPCKMQNLFCLIGFNPSKAEQPLRGMKIKEKEAQKD